MIGIFIDKSGLLTIIQNIIAPINNYAASCVNTNTVTSDTWIGIIFGCFMICSITGVLGWGLTHEFYRKRRCKHCGKRAFYNDYWRTWY